MAGSFLLAMAFSHLALVASVVPLLRNGYQDFTIFYAAGRIVRNGQASSLYDANAQYEEQQKFAPNVSVRRAALPYNHPPFEALLFAPLTFMGYFPAYLTWTVLNLAALAASGWLTRRNFAKVEAIGPALLGLAGVAFFPVVIAIVQGQDSILLLFLTVLAMVAAEQRKDTAAGAILALGLFKFHLMIPFVLVVAAKRPRVLAGFIPTTVALIAVSMAMLGWHRSFDYIQFILRLENRGVGSGISATQMPSLHGLIANLASEGTTGFWAALVTVAGSLAVLAAALRGAQKQATTVPCLFALAAVAALLLGYHTMQHDLSLLLPATVFLFASAKPENGPGSDRADRVLLALLYLTPVYVLLGLYWNRLGLFAIVLVWFMLRLLRKDAPAPASAL